MITPIKKLTDQQKYDIAKGLVSPSGFYRTFYKLIKYFDGNKSCFTYLNDIYLDVFNNPRYTDYDSFRKWCYRRKLKNRK